MKNIRLFSQITLISILSLFSIEYYVNFSGYNLPYPINEPKDATYKESIDYLIITSQRYIEEVKPLDLWKKQKGLGSKIEFVEDIIQKYSGVDLPAKIKTCINEYYTINETQWVLLAGDYEDIPSRKARIYDNFTYKWDDDYVSCDFYFSDLDNDWDLNNDGIWGTDLDEFDFHAEVYVGRLPANNNLEMSILVNRIINYEKNPPVGPWMTHALYAGAMLCFDQDWDDDDIADFYELDANRFHNFLKNRIPDNWTSTILAENYGLKVSDYPHDGSLSEYTLEDAINEGPAICMILGHGNPQTMVRRLWISDLDSDHLFDYTADPQFNNGEDIDIKKNEIFIDTTRANLHPNNDQFGVYYLGGCSTGTFDLDFDCLAEFILKTAAIGCIAGSNVLFGEDNWYEREQGGWYLEGLATRFWDSLFECNQLGEALALAKENYSLDRIASGEVATEPVWEDKILKQFNLFGDPEAFIWLNEPEKLSITEINSSDENSEFFHVKANTNYIKDAIVTITNNEKVIWVNVANEEGFVNIPFLTRDFGVVTLTINKKGYIPYQTLLNISKSIVGYELMLVFIISTVSICFYIFYLNHFKSESKFSIV